MNPRCVALLGQRDSPTDAVEEYCRYLAEALVEHGVELEIMRVAWAEKGWQTALRDLRASACRDAQTWFLPQYTALAWSRRGFSWRILSVIRLLKRSGARVATVFHDAEPYFGDHIVDRTRRLVQRYTMRKAVRLSDVSILTVPGKKLPWLAGLLDRTAFIPVGANLPSPEKAWLRREADSGQPPTVGVFSVSDGQVGIGEANAVAESVSHVADGLGALRVAVMGRNSEMAGRILQEKLRGKPIELVVHGLLSGEEVVNALGACDAMLFVRGPISSRRGSAIAGIACGLPVVAREGWETAAPILEAGVVLVPSGASREFGPALLRVLSDRRYRTELAERSRRAQTRYFCWQAIAARYAKILGKHDKQE
ncbi:MAG TPA: hypothetical protein VE077_06960 [Candidatus Methylomirabilis sp.]|nr:hypothetical protein [Candidatus Methylomirabilis sp.]